jgi:hypothetical protein
MIVTVPNPAARSLRPVHLITDRAKRYRAHRNPPAGPKVCARCGSKRNILIDHKDGNESNGARRNLQWLCKTCNAVKAVEQIRAGIGVRTRQYNPVPTYAQYAWAVATHTGRQYVRGRGFSQGDHDEAGAIIHATPPELRSEYARRFASSRRKRRAADAVPF